MIVLVVILAVTAGAMHVGGRYMGLAAPYAVVARNASAGLGVWCLAVLARSHHIGGGGLLVAGFIAGLVLIGWGALEVPQVERWLKSLKSGGNKPTSGAPSA